MNPIIPEDGGILIRRNVGNHLRHAMTSHPRRLESREIPNGKHIYELWNKVKMHPYVIKHHTEKVYEEMEVWVWH